MCVVECFTAHFCWFEEKLVCCLSALMSSQLPSAVTGLMFLMFLIIQFFRFRVADTEQYFLCQFDFVFVRVDFKQCAVLPSSSYSTLTEQSVSEDVSFSVPGRASQDVSVFMRLNAPAQGSTTILCDT